MSYWQVVFKQVLLSAALGRIRYVQNTHQLGMSQVAVTFSPCVVCRHAIHEEREANKGAALQPCGCLVHLCCVARHNLVAGARCPTCHTAITGHKELLDHFGERTDEKASQLFPFIVLSCVW